MCLSAISAITIAILYWSVLSRVSIVTEKQLNKTIFANYVVAAKVNSPALQA